MATFYQIQNVDNLFNMLDKCVGAIFITSSAGDKVDIRNSPLIRELLTNACQKHGIETLNIIVENSQDIPRILSYLLGCNCRAAIK